MRRLFKRKSLSGTLIYWGTVRSTCRPTSGPGDCALWATRLSLCTSVSPNILKLLLLSSSFKKFSKFAGVVSEDKEMWIDVSCRLRDGVRR
jgi:hypothetical protein